jgi:Phage gp6-like head-tail connector protein
MHSILEILEESTDSAGPDLITLDELKGALGITDNSEDAQLQNAITMQSRIIAEYCDRRFGRAEAMETFSFNRGEIMPAQQALTLSLYPVSEILEVSTAGATAADFKFDPASGRLWLPMSWLYGFGYYAADGYYWNTPYTIAVVYSGGYDLPEEAPARLQRAIIECVNSVRTSSAFGVRDPSIREVQHGDTRISYVSQSFAAGTTGQHLTPSVTDLIKPYRRIGIA